MVFLRRSCIETDPQGCLPAKYQKPKQNEKKIILGYVFRIMISCSGPAIYHKKYIQ